MILMLEKGSALLIVCGDGQRPPLCEMLMTKRGVVK